jgi:uncharacterized membrane protein
MIVPALAASALARIAPVLGAGLGRLWAAIRSPAVLAILALALGWQTLRIEGLHWTLSIAGLRLPVIARDGLRDRLATAQADLARVTAAQAQARADQAAANHHPAAVSARIAEISDAQASRYYAQGRAAGAAWAAAHSLHDACPARGPANPALPGADHPAPLDDRSGDTAAWLPSPRRLRPLHRQQRPPRPDASGRPRPDRPGRGRSGPMIDETMAEGEDIPADPSTLIRLGTITAVTLSPPRCVVRYGDPEADEDCETPPIRWLALRAGKTRHWSPPAWARKPCCCAPMARSAMAWPCSVSTTTPRPRPATPWPN